MPALQQAALGLGGAHQRPQRVTAERKRKHDGLQALVASVDGETLELCNQFSELHQRRHEQAFEDVAVKAKRIKECRDELANIQEQTRDMMEEIPEMPNPDRANVVKGISAGSIALLEKFASAARQGRTG